MYMYVNQQIKPLNILVHLREFLNSRFSCSQLNSMGRMMHHENIWQQTLFEHSVIIMLRHTLHINLSLCFEPAGSISYTGVFFLLPSHAYNTDFISPLIFKFTQLLKSKIREKHTMQTGNKLCNNRGMSENIPNVNS